MQVIREHGAGEAIGTALGKGISNTLQLLANQKMQEVQERKQQSGIQQSLEAAGVPRIIAQKLSFGPEKERLAFLNDWYSQGLGALGVDQQEQQPQDQIIQQLAQEIQQQNQPNATQQRLTQPVAQEKPVKTYADIPRKKQQKPKSPAVLKHEEAIYSQRENLKDFVDTTNRMLQTLGSKKVSVGVIPSLTASFAPTFLGNETELFDKDAAHIVNLASADIKGVPSRFRVQLIEKEKPGLKHSEKVNKQILERYKKQAEEKLSSLDKRYPDLAELDQRNENEPAALQELSSEGAQLPVGTVVEASDGQQYRKTGPNPNDWENV